MRLRSSARVAMGLTLLFALATACARVQPHLSLPALEIGQPEFVATVVAYTGAAVVGPNRVDILLNGDLRTPRG